tara:strand:- start:275 stop:526 length:252 start_codon:yes stop_codon:yes gene_type:complete
VAVVQQVELVHLVVQAAVLEVKVDLVVVMETHLQLLQLKVKMVDVQLTPMLVLVVEEEQPLLVDSVKQDQDLVDLVGQEQVQV